MSYTVNFVMQPVSQIWQDGISTFRSNLGRQARNQKKFGKPKSSCSMAKTYKHDIRILSDMSNAPCFPYGETCLRFLRFLSLPSGPPPSFMQYSRFLTARCHIFAPDPSMITCNILKSSFLKERIHSWLLLLEKRCLNPKAVHRRDCVLARLVDTRSIDAS